ncbi:metallophosphoesterase [Paenibacillus sp. ACRRX]|uniref:metallophosphoesterase family protein n=1 Tax=unclassified Paenibacillus TaxID=185978 RepID=UPI001EF61686|nr:metallophosphoesterase [Paenibacillus sp. UMB4589-SE434]MCG7406209.1 metallophosphoesterase [Paenibacillus sp. ACRRX]MDK8179242.1 metallophosphoesterase [Paenibacillus sp. UMB4589-SE434]
MGNEPILVFPVISDVHIGPGDDEEQQAMDVQEPTDIEKYAAALNLLRQLAPAQDVMVIVGDLTNQGTVPEYTRHMETLMTHKHPDAELLITIGNHDYWNNLPVTEAQERFLHMSGMKHLYQQYVIKGYHFIMLATEDGTTHGLYSLDQIEWLKSQLLQAAQQDPDKPIFVFLHQHIADTVYGSAEWGIQQNKEALYEALRPYPQVITFSGHSHYPLNDPRSIHQRDFTSVGTGSIRYMEVEKGRIQGALPLKGSEFSQGLIVEVYHDGVQIRRIDFCEQAEISEPWLIPLPVITSTFKYTDNRDQSPPVFPTDARLLVHNWDKSTSSLTIAWKQANDDQQVHHYEIQLFDDDDQLLQQWTAFSESYRYTMPDPLVITLSDLPDDIMYTTAKLTVRAVDSFGYKSDEWLTCRVEDGQIRTRI